MQAELSRILLDSVHTCEALARERSLPRADGGRVVAKGLMYLGRWSLDRFEAGTKHHLHLHGLMAENI